MATGSITQQEGMHHYDDYFDVMLIGKTGLGKTTTADKLLVANQAGKKYVYQLPSPQDEGSPSAEIESILNKSSTDANKPSPISKNEDITMWHISDEPRDIDMVEQRLKNLTFCRTLENPHQEITSVQQTEPTKFCELLSNDTSKVRVLDIPGFFGSESTGVRKDVLDRAATVGKRNLQIMRKILHIKEVYNFKFNRIVYFLPETGVLRRHSEVLLLEIETMETYFGHSIFQCMVVATTHPASSYDFFPKDVELYREKDFESTRFHFQEAMQTVFGTEDVPKPPIAFLSYWETCEGMMDLVRQAKVEKEGVSLSFNSYTCARCDIQLQRVRAKLETDNKEKVTVCMDSSYNTIPYDETTCHPMMIPKYTKFERFLGGIAHLITLYQFVGRWPNFKSFEEICIACSSDPGTRGCKQVRKLYRKLCEQCQGCRNCKKCNNCRKSDERIECPKCKLCERCLACRDCMEGIQVDHTDQVLERYRITSQGEDISLQIDGQT